MDRVKGVTIFPLTGNAGEDLGEVVEGLLDRIVAEFGGYTTDSIAGAWHSDDGMVYRDSSVRVTVVIPADAREEFRELVRDAKSALGQEAMYLEFQEAQVEFL